MATQLKQYKLNIPAVTDEDDNILTPAKDFFGWFFEPDKYYDKTDINNKFKQFELDIDWKESVETFADIAKTYPTPDPGWTVFVKSEAKQYRYNGTKWVDIFGSIPLASATLDGLMSKGDFTKLAGIEAGANKYVHPSNHPASMITETSTKRFVTDAQITAWSAMNDNVNNKVDKTFLLNKKPLSGTTLDLTADDVGALSNKGGRLSNPANYLNPVELEFWRGSNSSWKIQAETGTLNFLNNYDGSKVVDYFKTLMFYHNTGNIEQVKGEFRTSGAVISAAFKKINGTATQLLLANGAVTDLTKLLTTDTPQTITGNKTFDSNITLNKHTYVNHTLLFSANLTSKLSDGRIEFRMAGSDYARIWAGSPSDTSGDGVLYIDLGDNGNEQLFVRQIGQEDTPSRTLTLIDKSGNSLFPGSITADKSVISKQGFIKQGSSDAHVLLAGGGTKPVSEFALASGADYLPLAGGTLTGNVTGKTITATSFVKSGGTATQLLLANGTVKATTDFATSGHTHSYAGSASVGGAANTALKLRNNNLTASENLNIINAKLGGPGTISTFAIARNTAVTPNTAGGTGGFPTINNANVLMAIQTHGSSANDIEHYEHQLGFSGNGTIYHRNCVGNVWNAWSKLITELNNDFMRVLDTQDLVNPDRDLEPGYYTEKKINASFSMKIPIATGWRSLINVKGWSNGYKSWQLIGPSNTYDANQPDELYLRTSKSDTEWNPVSRIWHSGNFNPANGIEAASFKKTGSSSSYVLLGDGSHLLRQNLGYTSFKYLLSGTTGTKWIKFASIDYKDNTTQFLRDSYTFRFRANEFNANCDGDLKIFIRRDKNNLQLNAQIFNKGTYMLPNIYCCTNDNKVIDFYIQAINDTIQWNTRFFVELETHGAYNNVTLLDVALSTDLPAYTTKVLATELSAIPIDAIVHSIEGKIYPRSTTNRNAGMYGTYEATKIGHIWSMSTQYSIPADGSNFGTIYGFAYKHTTNTTGGTMAGGHQAVWCGNGIPKSAIGDGLWTSGAITGHNLIVQNMGTIKNLTVTEKALIDILYAPKGAFQETTTFSDERLKDNIKEIEIEQYFDSIDKLETVEFNWKSDENKTKRFGVIAQEIQKYFPDLVVEFERAENETYLTVDYTQLLMLKTEWLNKRLKLAEERLAKIEQFLRL